MRESDSEPRCGRRTTWSLSDAGRVRAGIVAVLLGTAAVAMIVVAAYSSPTVPASAGSYPACSGTDDVRQAFPTIRRMLGARRHDDRIPGLAAEVVCGDSLVFAEGYGVTDLDDPQPVTPATRFRIASVTKLFTATATVKLAESGRLDLDAPVKGYLPWFRVRRPPQTGSAPITVRQLLTHTSGLPRDSRLTDFSRLYQPPRAAAIAALPSQALLSEPGTTYAYSNLGYGILGEIIAATSGMTYAEYVGTRLSIHWG